MPSCGQCASKGLQCEPRTSKHSSDAVYRQAKRQLSAYSQASNRTSTTNSNASSVHAGHPSLQQDGQESNEQPSQAGPSEHGTVSPTRSLLPGNSISPVTDDLPLSFGSPKQMDMAEATRGGTPQLLQHGLQHISPDFTNSGIDQYLGMVTDITVSDVEHQYLMRDGMPPPLDFSFVDISSFISPDSTDANIFRSPTMFPDRIHASPPPSPPPTSSNHSMPPSAPNSSPVPVNPSSVPSTMAGGYFVQDLEAVAGVQEGWPCFRCNPLPNAAVYPKTGRLYIEGLEYTLNNHNAWESWTPPSTHSEENTVAEDKITVDPFRGNARDKLMVITQSFLNRARDTHGSSPTRTPGTNGRQLPNNPTVTGFQGFIILPPSNVLEYLLRAYASRFELYYPSLPACALSPAELMESSTEKASSLLLLLMIAEGAMGCPSIEARYLTSGLTEACRISLFDLLEKDVSLALDPIMLRSALLFMNLAAWSGDKWHMDVNLLTRYEATKFLADDHSLLLANMACISRSVNY